MSTLKAIRKSLKGTTTDSSSSESASEVNDSTSETELRHKYGDQVVDLAVDNQMGVGDRLASQMAAQLLLSLEGFHASGIILRDVKEDNVMLSSKGYLRVVDFGLAVKVPPEWGNDPATAPTTHGKTFSSIPSLEEETIAPERMLQNHISGNGVRMKLKPAGTPRTLP